MFLYIFIDKIVTERTEKHHRKKANDIPHSLTDHIAGSCTGLN